MKRSNWTRVVLALVAASSMAFAGLAGCKSASEPAEPDPEPVVAPTPAAPAVPVPALEEVEEGLTPVEQQALAAELATEAAAEINAENIAEAVAALEAELADAPAD